MRSLYFLLISTFFILSSCSETNDDEGVDLTVTFTKADNADFTLAENQDRITDNVWITRGNNQSIFNIRVEEAFEANVSPVDTEWAFGTTQDLSSLNFQDFQSAVDRNPMGAVGRDMVLHLITDDIFLDIRFTSFTGGGGGGGFSYLRSAVP